MFGHEHKKIELAADRIEAIRAAVEAVDTLAKRASLEEMTAVSALPHLTDAEFLTLCEAGTADPLRQETRAHLAQCPECRSEWERLQRLGEVWQDQAALERLEARRRAALRAADPGLMPMPERRRTTLAALIPLPTAYAAHAMPDIEAVNFPVYGEDGLISSLIATLQRRNHMFYALITPSDDEAVALYGERSVVLTIADGEDRPPFLRREIGIGVAVLLGTHLPLASTSFIQADLAPP